MANTNLTNPRQVFVEK